MSCQNPPPPPHQPSCCSAPSGTRPGACSNTYFSCPVVCTPSIPSCDALPPATCLTAALVVFVIGILKDPSVLCESCDDGETGQIICIDRCTIPFTGQQVTKIKVDLSSIPVPSSVPCTLPAFTITVYEKCGTVWFKLPNALFLDLCYAADYPSDIGSVSITMPTGCPKAYTARILIDGFCYPINVKATFTDELIAQCGCPPYLDHMLDLQIDSSFQKYLNTQQLQCLDYNTLLVLGFQTILSQIKTIYLGYVLANIPEVKEACGCTQCSIGNSCTTAQQSCPYSTSMSS